MPPVRAPLPHMLQITLYNDCAPNCVEFGALAAFLAENVPWASVAFGGDLVTAAVAHLSPAERGQLLEKTAWLLARARVHRPDHLLPPREPHPMEASVERRRLERKGDTSSPGVPLDGFRTQVIYARLIARADAVQIVVTGRLLLTYDPDDLRYHARTIVPGRPALISVPGLVEGPAKPREYYQALHALGRAGLDELARASAAKAIWGRFLAHGDDRTTEVLKGYLLQAVAYELTGDPFCPDPNCRLYNAHHQEEMLHAQMGSGSLCARHQALFASRP